MWFWPWAWSLFVFDNFWSAAEIVGAPLEARDVDAAAELHSEAFDQPWTGSELAKLLAQTGTFGMVARRIGEIDGPPLGFVLARLIEGEAEILTIAVARRARAQGIGRLLMDQVLQFLHAERASVLHLEVNETNTAALRLYKRLRFEEVGTRPSYYKDAEGKRHNALVLSRALR